jgi:hypothetical protein
MPAPTVSGIIVSGAVQPGTKTRGLERTGSCRSAFEGAAVPEFHKRRQPRGLRCSSCGKEYDDHPTKIEPLNEVSGYAITGDRLTTLEGFKFETFQVNGKCPFMKQATLDG